MAFPEIEKAEYILQSLSQISDQHDCFLKLILEKVYDLTFVIIEKVCYFLVFIIEKVYLCSRNI